MDPLEASTDVPPVGEMTPFEEMPRAQPVNLYNFSEEQLAANKEYIYQLSQRFPSIPPDLLELAVSYYTFHGDEKVTQEIADGKFDKKSEENEKDD